MPMKLTGGPKTIRQLRRFREVGLERAAQGGVDRSVKKLFADSTFFVPKKTGALLSTAHIFVDSGSGSTRASGVRFGEPGEGEGIIDYAAAVHEILKASHAAPTKAKYVEDPLVQGEAFYKKVTMYEARKQVRRIFR